MKKIFVSLFILIYTSLCVFADDVQDAIKTFNSYVNAANTYSHTVENYYSPSAKIIRQVIKPDGTTKDVYTDTQTYMKQMKIGQAGAKLKQYKNTYTNISATQIKPGMVKVSSIRHPSGDNDSLKAYMIFQKLSNGNWIIIEEMMQTRQQIFLKYAK